MLGQAVCSNNVLHVLWKNGDNAMGKGKLSLDLQLNLAESVQLSFISNQMDSPISPQ